MKLTIVNTRNTFSYIWKISRSEINLNLYFNNTVELIDLPLDTPKINIVFNALCII